jgi:hypothetical protein
MRESKPSGEEERVRLHFWFVMAVRRFEGVYFQRRLGFVDAAVTEGFERSHISILASKTVQFFCARAKEKLGARNLAQLIYTAVLLCKADMAPHLNELLNGVGSIEMRYFDLRGKLIATSRLECTSPARKRKRPSRS